MREHNRDDRANERSRKCVMFENVSLKEFLNYDGSGVEEFPLPSDLSEYDKFYKGTARQCLVEISSQSEFTFYLMSSKGETIVFHSSGKTAGVFHKDTALVSWEFEGEKLATALVLFAYQHGYQRNEKRKLTCGGLAVLRKAWKVGRGKKEIVWWPLRPAGVDG
jgi:hypothetical protein